MHKKSLFNVLNPHSVMVNNLQKHEEEDIELDLSCAICMCELEKDEYVYNLCCKHLFHIDCLENWYSRKDICPLCKRHMDFVVTTEDCYTFDRSEYEKKKRLEASTVIEMHEL